MISFDSSNICENEGKKLLNKKGSIVLAMRTNELLDFHFKCDGNEGEI